MPRVLAIGIDSGDWTYIESLVEAGLLPNLAHLLSIGTWHRLTSRDFAFNHFLAGRAATPGDPWGGCRFDPENYSSFQPLAVGQLGGPAFYERIPGLRTIVFDVPWCGLGSSPDVVEVLAWGAHSPNYPRASRPAGLIQEIDRRVGHHPGFRNSFQAGWHNPAELNSLVEACLVGARRRSEALAMLQERYPDWQLALVFMSETHDAGEILWHGVDPAHPLAKVVDARRAASRLEQVYRGVDKAIGRMVHACPPDTSVVIFSLFGSCIGHGDVASIVLLPELLHRLQGEPPALRSGNAAVWKEAGCPPVVPRRSETKRDAIQRFWIFPEARGARSFDKAERIVRRHLRPLVVWYRKRFGRRTVGSLGYPIPGETRVIPGAMRAEDGPRLDWQFAARYRRWWPGMRAFALPSFSDGTVRVNLAGREANGIVSPADYDTVCDEVEDTIRACTNPRTGRPAVRDVIRAPLEAAMDGAARYADIVVHWDGPIDALEHPVAGLIGPVPFDRAGSHTSNAFAIVCPQNAYPKATPPERTGTDVGAERTGSILDLPPTFLALLGRAAPEDFEGSPLVDVAYR